LTGTLFIDPIRKFRLLTMARPMTRSLADLRLMLQVISGPDGHDSEVPPVPWRQARPMKLTRLQAAYPPSVAGEIRAGTEALAVELDKPGREHRELVARPPAGDGQFADELSSILASQRRRPGQGRMSRVLGRRGTTWRWAGATGSWPPGTGSSLPATFSHPDDADVRLTQSVNRTHWGFVTRDGWRRPYPVLVIVIAPAQDNEDPARRAKRL
jgi:hypothetical protein